MALSPAYVRSGCQPEPFPSACLRGLLDPKIEIARTPQIMATIVHVQWVVDELRFLFTRERSKHEFHWHRFHRNENLLSRVFAGVTCGE